MLKHIVYISSFLLALSINLLCLINGIYNLPQHLYYIPILLGIFLYGKVGILLTFFTSTVYVLSVLPFNNNDELLPSALVRSCIFISISVMVYTLNARNKKNETNLVKNMNRLHTTLLSIRDGVIVTDNMGIIEIISPKAEFICSLISSDVLGKPLSEVLKVYSEDGNLIHLCKDNYGKNQCTLPFTGRGFLLQADSSKREIELYIAPIIVNESIVEGNTIVLRDITEKMRAEEEIQFLTYHDKLTGLYNRRYFEQELIMMDKPDNYPLSIVIGDVNGLKLTNDAFGHKAGDKLLSLAADSLQRVCRVQDVLARWGGDEYIMLLPHTTGAEAAQIIQEVTCNNKGEFIDSINLSISLGYATKYDDSENIDTVIKQADDMMYKEKLSISRSVKNRTVNIILQTLYVKNEPEREHAKGVSRLMNFLEGSLNLTKSQITDLRVLGQIHDIGKITIDDSILNKEGKLTEQEFEIVKRHSDKGYQIIKASPELMYLADEVLSHHERYDGLGYPRGLKRDEIPKLARILAVADAVEAMLSDRPYRKALTLEETIQELKANSGTQFDPEVVNIFLKILPDKLF